MGNSRGQDVDVLRPASMASSSSSQPNAMYASLSLSHSRARARSLLGMNQFGWFECFCSPSSLCVVLMFALHQTRFLGLATYHGFSSHAWFAIGFSNFDVATWRYRSEQMYRFMVYVWLIRFMHIFNLLPVVIVI